MRSYPRNSPEAAARIVALILISDGHVSRSEYEALNQLNGVQELGLQPEQMPGIVQTLCEDLLMDGFDGRSLLSHVSDESVVSLLAEVNEPQLQNKVLRVAGNVVHADQHLSDGEAAMLDEISRRWGLSPPALTPAGSI
jgi:tellurite resistance protein